MTVLVGILCQDGVVLGSDSSATFVAGQMRTIEQACQKLYAVGNTVMFALIPSGVVADVAKQNQKKFLPQDVAP